MPTWPNWFYEEHGAQSRVDVPMKTIKQSAFRFRIAGAVCLSTLALGCGLIPEDSNKEGSGDKEGTGLVQFTVNAPLSDSKAYATLDRSLLLMHAEAEGTLVVILGASFQDVILKPGSYDCGLVGRPGGENVYTSVSYTVNGVRFEADNAPGSCVIRLTQTVKVGSPVQGEFEAVVVNSKGMTLQLSNGKFDVPVDAAEQ